MFAEGPFLYDNGCILLKVKAATHPCSCKQRKEPDSLVWFLGCEKYTSLLMCMSSSPLGQGPPEPSTRKPTFVAAVIAAVESGARKNASARGKVFVRSNSRIEGDD